MGEKDWRPRRLTTERKRAEGIETRERASRGPPFMVCWIADRARPGVIAVLAALSLAAPAHAQNLAVRLLSPEDRISYTNAFDALRRGELELARRSAQQARDRVLLGRVEFERLFHPDHTATYEELSAWLDDYADLPEARRAYDLAQRRKPDGVADPRRPTRERGWSALMPGGGRNMEHDPARAARVAYNNQDLAGAVSLGREVGDWWTVGLASYRLDQFAESFEAFRRVAEDPTEDAWVRAGAGFWAARSAGRGGQIDQVQPMLRLAAQWPATFYGQIALHQLGEAPTIQNQGPRPYFAEAQQATYTPVGGPGVAPAELEAFVRDEPLAKRAVALMEVGRSAEAGTEVRRGLRTAASDTAHRMWVGLAQAMGVRARDADARVIDAVDYPTPELQPEGGFTLERALVYALARKETGFDAGARSSVGAYGMMQVMPYTAAELTGDAAFRSEPERLLTPATNLRIGQAYVNRLLASDAFQGDLLRAVASYNAGPGPMLGALRKLGPDADPLLLIETIDVPQARDYVEKVVAAYWIYQRIFGGPLNTLEAVARGDPRVPLALDHVPAAPTEAPAQVAQLGQAAPVR